MENVGKGASTLFEFSFFGLFDVTITETAVSAFVVMILLILVSWLLGRNLKKRPGRMQCVTEKGVTALYNMVSSTMGEHNIGFAPYIGVLFLSSVCGSLIGMTGFLKSTTADLSTTLAWALVTPALVWYNTIKRNGVLGWLKGFTEPIVVMTPMNIVSEIAQPMSLAFRHFGNVAGGGVLTSLIYAALALASSAALSWVPNEIIRNIPILQVGIPAVLSIYFDLFSGCIQALVFCMLTMCFVADAIGETE